MEALYSLPQELKKTYDHIVGLLSKQYHKITRKVLCCLAFSFRNLSLEELLDAVATEDG